MSSLLPGSSQDVSNVISSVTSVTTVSQVKVIDNPQTPSQAFVAALKDMVKQKPQSAAEAAALYAYIIHKEVYPLLSELKNLFVSELSQAEKDASAGFLAEGNKFQEAIVSKVKGCLPFLNK